MIVEILSYKYIDESQKIDLSTIRISTLIGENGSGKSTLLEYNTPKCQDNFF